MGLFDIFKKKAEDNSTPKTAIKVEVKTSPIMTQQDDIVPIEKRIKGKKPTRYTKTANNPTNIVFFLVIR